MSRVCMHLAGKVLPIILFFILPAFSYSENIEGQYKKIQEKMLEQKKKISEAQNLEHSVLKEIEDINEKLNKIERELRTLRKKLGQTKSKITAVNAEITSTKNSLERQKDWIKRKIRTMHKFGNAGDTMMLLLSAEDISQAMRIWKYLENITRHEHTVLVNYRENLKLLDEKNNELQILKNELLVNENTIEAKELELAEEKKFQELLLASVRQKKAEYQKMLSKLKQASKRLRKLIKEASKTDSYSATGFSRLKGKLSWPASGIIAIPYGSQKDAQFDTPIFRNGVHIKTDSNADVKSVYKGKVIFAEWFQGFGKLVIINHGSGYNSLYGNLSEIFSQVGDIIKEDHVIGKIGTSEILNAPGLYFEVRYKGKPLDPTQWLKNKGG